jgi:hypothetical protein
VECLIVAELESESEIESVEQKSPGAEDNHTQKIGPCQYQSASIRPKEQKKANSG